MRFQSLLSAALFVLAVPALADEGWERTERIRAAAEAALAAGLPASARVTTVPLDARLRLPACAQAPRASIPAGTMGAAVNVPVQCDGPVAWTIYVSARVADIRPVVVVRRGAGRGEVLSADMVGVENRDIAVLPLGYLDDPARALGLVLRRPLAPGAALTPDALEAPRLIRRGELVTLLGRSGAIEVRAQGRALADGRGGEPIAVENTATRRVIQGVVSAAGLVEVRL